MVFPSLIGSHPFTFPRRDKSNVQKMDDFKRGLFSKVAAEMDRNEIMQSD